MSKVTKTHASHSPRRSTGKHKYCSRSHTRSNARSKDSTVDYKTSRSHTSFSPRTSTGSHRYCSRPRSYAQRSHARSRSRGRDKDLKFLHHIHPEEALDHTGIAQDQGLMDGGLVLSQGQALDIGTNKQLNFIHHVHPEQALDHTGIAQEQGLMHGGLIQGLGLDQKINISSVVVHHIHQEHTVGLTPIGQDLIQGLSLGLEDTVDHIEIIQGQHLYLTQNLQFLQFKVVLQLHKHLPLHAKQTL